MANQYGVVAVQYHKCGNPDCDAMVKCLPGQKNRGAGKYCSTVCAHKMMHLIKYTDEDIQWIADNIKTMTIAMMSRRFNSTEGALRRAITNFRKRGYVIQKGNKGRVTTPKATQSNTGSVIAGINKSTRNSGSREKIAPQAKVREKKQAMVAVAAPKKEVKKMPTLAIKTEGKRFVEIKKGTWALRAVNA